ncbi:MAG: helix-turn-helix domain-containing protein [Cohaesibacter sp.]|nr:helix-turn-helix domain-containing protein [Cohaesibacter sp.]
MSDHLRLDAFDLIKQAMKARQLTYAQLADMLDLSEPSIKRMFAERDCKLSRLMKICDLLDLDPSDLFDLSKRHQSGPITLARDIEAMLARDPSLFHFFILLRETETAEDIRLRYQLSAQDIFLYGLALERLGLAHVDEHGVVRLSLDGPIQFRSDGPLRPLLRRLNTSFLGHLIDHQCDETQDLFATLSRRISQDTFVHIRSEIEALRDKIADLSRQDQMLLGKQKLHSFKLTLGWGKVDYPALLTIAPKHKE